MFNSRAAKGERCRRRVNKSGSGGTVHTGAVFVRSIVYSRMYVRVLFVRCARRCCADCRVGCNFGGSGWSGVRTAARSAQVFCTAVGIRCTYAVQLYGMVSRIHHSSQTLIESSW